MSSRSRRDKAARRRRGRLTLASFPAPTSPWTPVSMLEDFLSELRSGTIRPGQGVLVFFYEEHADGTLKPALWSVGLTPEQQIAGGEMVKRLAIKAWEEGVS